MARWLCIFIRFGRITHTVWFLFARYTISSNQCDCYTLLYGAFREKAMIKRFSEKSKIS